MDTFKSSMLQGTVSIRNLEQEIQDEIKDVTNQINKDIKRNEEDISNLNFLFRVKNVMDKSNKKHFLKIKKYFKIIIYLEIIDIIISLINIFI